MNIENNEVVIVEIDEHELTTVTGGDLGRLLEDFRRLQEKMDRYRDADPFHIDG